MRRVVQISDLHFGNNDPALLEPLRKAIDRIQPHVLVISGDFVEHATAAEFLAAQEFIGRLPKPQVLVPGNHDLAFYNVAVRAFTGLRNYRHYISNDMHPRFEDEEIAVLGANTSRVWPLRGGSLSSTQLEELAAEFAAIDAEKTRILVTHHPFDLPEGQHRRLIVGHARRSIARLAPTVDIMLAGHIHLSSTGSTATHYKTAGHAIAFVQAGTAVSNRNKGEMNSFNLLEISSALEGGKAVKVDRYMWKKEASEFGCACSTEFRLESEGWARVEPTAAVHEEPGVEQTGVATKVNRLSL